MRFQPEELVDGVPVDGERRVAREPSLDPFSPCGDHLRVDERRRRSDLRSGSLGSTVACDRVCTRRLDGVGHLRIGHEAPQAAANSVAGTEALAERACVDRDATL